MKGILNKMKYVAVALVLVASVATIFSFRTTPTTQYMQITTIESIIPGGLGRSKMLVVYPDGKTEETDLKNLYSMVGINFGNIETNMQAAMAKVNGFTNQGWSLVNVTANSQSPSEKSSEGIFMTRYLLQKSE